MPWTKSDYPASMKKLPAEVRNKSIEIANALLEEKDMEEGIAIATAISRAKDWAANRGKPFKSEKPGRTTDVKEHGEDRYVVPAGEGWRVEKEKKNLSELYAKKTEAVKAAKKEAKAANAGVTILKKHGKVQEKISYNPNKKAAKQR